MTALLATAFAAGLVSTVNPCGFAMLPAYLGYFLGAGEGAARRWPSVVGALTAGFLGVFGLAGTLVALGLRSAVSAIPWAAALVGLDLVVLGVGVASGRVHLPSLPQPGKARRSRSFGGMFLFGISYAVASLSCTLPIFLSLVAGTLTGRSAAEAALAFISYGLGMGFSLGVITVALAVGWQGLVRRARLLGRHLEVVSGWVMIVAGGFILWYWFTVLRSGATALGGSFVVGLAERAARAVAGSVSTRPLLVLVVVVSVLVGGMWWSRRQADEPGDG
jgi:cytochrome c biogenesis protein CcdA